MVEHRALISPGAPINKPGAYNNGAGWFHAQTALKPPVRARTLTPQ
jgi:hypothetical protein